jgi:hypothetical protein
VTRLLDIEHQGVDAVWDMAELGAVVYEEEDYDDEGEEEDSYYSYEGEEEGEEEYDEV